jgi:hypothetical protein
MTTFTFVMAKAYHAGVDMSICNVAHNSPSQAHLARNYHALARNVSNHENMAVWKMRHGIEYTLGCSSM